MVTFAYIAERIREDSSGPGWTRFGMSVEDGPRGVVTANFAGRK